MLDCQLSCTCGRVRLAVSGDPIITTECHCDSCREAAGRFQALGAPEFLSPNGGTPFVMMRKDRITILSGHDEISAMTLGPDMTTRRYVTTCCNTPVFLEFKGGHWLSIYKSVWPTGTMPAIQLRTMTADLDDPTVLDGAIPSGKRQTWGFYAKLLGAWIAMGFRSPDVGLAERR